MPKFLFFRTLLAVSVLFVTAWPCDAQTLYDVVISLSDRQRVVSQRDQVAVYLNNQNNPPSETDLPLPEDQPIDWLGVGTNPTQTAVDGLGIGGKIALLNQAAAKFEELAPQFLNANSAVANQAGNHGACP